MLNRTLKTFVSLMLSAGLAVSGGPIAVAGAEGVLPEKYDLRDDGLVTPVKVQDPWGSCWAFGGIAAMESSILSYMGETNESYKKLNNGKDFDLSEKHLAWFALQPVTEDIWPTQKGEGIFPLESGGQEAYYNLGGELIYIGTLLSSGIGPVYEEQFPYKGREGYTQRDWVYNNPEEVEKLAERDLGCTPEEFYEKNKKSGELPKLIEQYKSKGLVSSNVTADDFTVEDLKKVFTKILVNKTKPSNYYSDYDDWTIDEKNEEGLSNRNLTGGFVLKDANTLPEFSVKDDKGHWKGINEDGMRAVKQELLEGRGVIAGFRSDTSLPGQSETGKYLNLDTWAHYTYEDTESSHCICIVGWDDTYSKDNFIRGHRPPGDGAWIVKNSWGSETEYSVTRNGEKIGYRGWGVKNDVGKHTGYFYISYYDKTLEQPETISFNANILAAGKDMCVFAYDYMPCKGDPIKVADTKPIKTAAVFKNDSGEDLDLVSFSTKTATANAHVVYEVYRLKDNAGSPEDGEYLGRRTAFYPYAGFHREDMMKAVTVKDGESISIVVTDTIVNNDGKRLYEYAINNAFNKTGAENHDERAYGVGIVNKGENYLYTDNEWFDWTDIKDQEVFDAIDGDRSPEELEIDNFSIKAYLIQK